MLLLTLVLGLTPVGGRLVAWCGRRLGGSWPATVVGGTVALSVVTTAIALPLSVAAELVLRRYGLSTQNWPGWSLDVLRATAVSAVVTALGLVLLVGFARRWPSGWWLPGAAVAAALVVVGSALYPLVIEPLSNDFRSMPPSAQRTALLQLAARDGQPVSDVLVADASRRTTAENAYVSGLGATRRLVVYDTLLRGADEREVELVVAHELGHVADHDVARGTALGALGAAWAVVALALLSRRRWWWRRSGAVGPGDPRAVALLLALLAARRLPRCSGHEPRVAADRGQCRRPRAAAHPRPRHVRGDAAPARSGQHQRPAAALVPAAAVPDPPLAAVARGAGSRVGAPARAARAGAGALSRVGRSRPAPVPGGS